MHWVRFNCLMAFLALFSLMTGGCASTRPVGPPDEAIAKRPPAESPRGWWYARFGIKWPDKTEPSWNVDLFLADRVVGPVLEKHRDSVVLWRIHRRAARDNAGHQVSFIFYSTPREADVVFQDLRSNPQLRALKDSGIVVRDTYDSTVSVGKPRIEETSDRNWSSPVQRAWPFFIMGVSELWLKLIEETRAAIEGKRETGSMDEALVLYQKVNARITEIWRDEGRHAFLHHLNALFGYEPLVVYEKKLMGF